MDRKSGKEWSPRKYTSSELSDAFIASIENSIENQIVLTKYKGDQDGFNQFVANQAWAADTYKLIGENTGCILTALDLATDLGVELPGDIVRKAYLYSYTW